MEQIVFPVPNICEYLTEESKMRVFTTTERDDQGSKVNDFFHQFDNLYNEMRWQKKIRSKSSLHSASSSWKIIMIVVAVVAAGTGFRTTNQIPIQQVWLCYFHSKLKGLQWCGVCWIRVPVLMLPVVFAQKIRLCSGSHVTSLFGGASPSTWPSCSTLLWLYSTLLVTMKMRVRISAYFSNCNL